MIVDGVRYFTPLLDHDVSETGLRDALQEVVEDAFGFIDNGTDDVEVTRGGNVYRITFTDQMGEQDVPLLDIDDLGLTMETGAAPGDVLNVDNSADTADTQAVLTQTSLTGLGMGDLGTPGTTWNEIQTLRLDATGGTFALGIQGTAITSGPLAHDLSAAALDAVLEDMYLGYLNGLRIAAGKDPLSSAATAGGLVEVARNDDVYVIRFVGLLSNADVAQLTVDASGLTRNDELPGGAVVTVQGLAETATRLDGITAQSQNEIQRLTIAATGGTFTLSFPNGDAENTTAALPYDATRAQLQLALEALPAIVPGDVLLTEVSLGVFDIEFQGELSSTDVAQLIVNSSLTGGTASVETRQTGRDTGLNDLQVVTVAATAGTFRLELYLPAVQKTLTTEALAFDASAEQVRRALQHELARKLNGLNDDADLSRTREAFKSDFSVARIGNTYLIGFQGVTRQIDGGEGVSRIEVLGDAAFDASGGAGVTTRMDGINYYGVEEVNVDFGSGSDILNVQGTSAGSFKGINQPLDDVHAATNISLAGGDDRIFVSSNADLDVHTDRTTAGQPDVFEFLTGTLDLVSGNLNIDAGAGRHRLLVSDEAATAGDSRVTISDIVGAPSGAGGFDDTGAAEIQVKGLAFGDLAYGAATGANFYDGIIYWTGSGDDTIAIDGTHVRTGERTTTVLNTGLGDDHVTVDLDTGEDGFFVLHTMGGAASHTPVDPGLAASDDDTVRASGSTLPLIIFGGLGDDDIIAGQNEDVVFGDFGRAQFVNGSGQLIAVFGFGGRDDMISSQIVDPKWLISRDLNLGGDDILEGQANDDVLIGGAGGDYIDGDTDDDLIFGDAVQLFRRDTVVGSLGDITDPRFQALLGQVIYSRTDVSAAAQGIATLPLANQAGQVLVDRASRSERNQDGSTPAAWNEYVIVELYHSQSIENGEVAGLETSFGNDYLAGGAQNDTIFGQLGDDTIQGDGAIEGAVGADQGMNRVAAAKAGLDPVYARRVADGVIVLAPGAIEERRLLDYNPSFEAASDGDDYIEGNGGADVIFGNLGQDDIVGDNSSLFSLDTRDERLPHGSDIIFGGAGERIDRNAEVTDANRDTIVLSQRHARDADAIAGDNANIYRLVGMNRTDSGGFLAYGYDQSAAGEERGSLRIIPRAVELIGDDYTPGGPDFNSGKAQFDIGSGDEIHGESGDDVIYGMVGADVLFGDSEDDDLIGGYGNDWISGGTGRDGALGDDGRIFTSRYVAGTVGTFAEALYGVSKVDALNKSISTPGSIQQAVINPTIDGTSNTAGQIFKSVDLTPFSQQPDWTATDDEWGGDSTNTSDDIVYGGLGTDFLHAGSGDDAISGAEALPEFFAAPVNPGNVLGYDTATGEFAAYDEFDPLRKIVLNPAGALNEGEPWKPGDPGTPVQFFLNFDQTEGVLRAGGQVSTNGNKTIVAPDVHDDGADKIFGDLGNDWLVGGTGRDDLYGGWGDDLLNADDDHSTNSDANDQPDTHPTYEDRAYGGAGRDVLIGNTGGDRLIDWVGEFNSYLVPFAPFGMGTVSRTLQPQLAEFLYALSASDGADPSRAADTGADPARNGEPFGELGVVRQQDFAWQDQTGAPRDPQAGNIPGGKRDVLRSAGFNDGTTSGFFADSGKWSVQNNALQVSADSLGGDAVSVFQIGDALPGYFEVQASVLAIKPTGGWNANSFIIFDYQSKSDFKFAGIDVSINKLVMGHRDASGWHVDEQAAVKGGLKSDTYYNMLLSVNGLNATLVVDNKMVFTHTYAPRIVDGYSYGLNWGLVGVGSNNARGAFDNIQVQILPPQLTFDRTDDFAGQAELSFSGFTSGAWSVGGGIYTATPGAGTGMSLLDLGPDNLAVSSYLELSAKVSAAGRAGFVFDRYADGSFKFVALDAPADQVIIGHYTPKSGWTSDAVVSKVINAGASYTLGVTLKGTTVSVTLDGQVVLGYAFNAATVDGNFGLLATGGQASFDDVRVKTNDPAFAAAGGGALIAASSAGTAGATLTQDELDGIATVAISQWTEALGAGDARLAALADVRFALADLAGSELGESSGGTVLIDADAGGYGWFVDASPASSSEFRVRLDRNVLGAAPDSAAFGRMDLLTAVEHELGHLLGFEHGSSALMREALQPGVRYVLDDATPAAVPGAPAFDTYAGDGGIGAFAGIDWKSGSAGGWEVKLSPYDTGKPAKGASSIAPFDLNLLAKPGDFDSMGRSLLGKDKTR